MFRDTKQDTLGILSMVMMMKLKHVDELSGGRKRFRRRYPKAVGKALGEDFFQVPMKAREGAALVAEQERLVAEFEKIVAKTVSGGAILSPREHWQYAQKEADAMLSAIKGSLSVDEKREVLVDDLRRRGSDPVLIKAASAPLSDEPPVTMLDAKEMYIKERMDGAKGRNQKNRLDRVCRRIEAALGPLHKLALVDLKRIHGRKLRDHMMQAPAQGKAGKLVSAETVRREMNIVRAMVTLAIEEFDLEGVAKNPFMGLTNTNGTETKATDGDKRDPLPKDVLLAMRKRMREKTQVPALGLIWRLLEGTGCRGAEVVGLRREDVVLDGLYPHINVAWHEDRRVKTKVSIRSVPLVGDALVAAQEALTLSEGEPMLFPKYARENGPDGVSQALMKHLRTVTKNPRHVVYSLRHNMKDWLVLAGTSERVENRIMGHTVGGLGDRVYGGNDAKLQLAYEAMEKAVRGMEASILG